MAKCYEDLMNFKETVTNLVTSFKIEFLLKQDKLFREINTI